MQEIINKIHPGSYIIKSTEQNTNNIVKILIDKYQLKKSDIYIYNEEKVSIKIAITREIKRKLFIRPSGNYAIHIIKNANLLTVPAANSLLKIIEEPPKYAIIIFIIENINNMLDTIKSRCKKIVLLSENKYDAKKVDYLLKVLKTKYFYELSFLAEEIVKKEFDIIDLFKDWIYYLKEQKDYKKIKIINKYLSNYSLGLNKKFFLENLFINIKYNL